MKKTLKKAVACILSILMVLTIMPLSAFAADSSSHRDAWWGGGELKITEEPEYTTTQSLADEGVEYVPGDADYGFLSVCDNQDPMNVDGIKPVIFMSVFTYATGTDTKLTEQNYYAKGTSLDKAVSWDTAVNAGLQKDPTQLKAGDYITISFEFGGFDYLFDSMIAGYFNTDYLEPGKIARSKWSKMTAQGGNVVNNPDKFYDGYLTKGDPVVVNEDSFGLAMSSTDTTKAAYIGDKTNRSFGEHGIVYPVMAFKVLQDCSLADTNVFRVRDDFTTNFVPHDYDQMVAGGYDMGDLGGFQYMMKNNYSASDGKNWTYSYLPPVQILGVSDAPAEHVHNYTVTTNPATCTEAGSYTYTCDNADGNCDNVTYTVASDDTHPALPALGHDWVESTAAVPSTCTTPGTSAVEKCSRCDATQGGTALPLDPNNHEGTQIVINQKDATCSEDGYTGDTVWSCHQDVVITAGTTIAKHTLTLVPAKAPTYTEAGNNAYYVCDVDGKVYKDAAATQPTTVEAETLAKLSLTAVAAKDATCQADGNIAYWVDEANGKYFSDANGVNEISKEQTVVAKHALKHVEAKAATCQAAGNIEYYECTVDGKLYKDADATQAIASLADTVIAKHTLQHVAAKDATYDENGNIEYWYCATDDKYFADADAAKEITQADTVIAKLTGVTITAAASDLGTATVNGKDSVTVNRNDDITLVAKANEGATFAGWEVNGKIVSDQATFTTKALADATYTAIFEATKDTSFTVVFTDKYGNVFYSQTVKDASEIKVSEIPVPTVAGYTFVGWSLTDEEIAQLTSATTINAVYEQNQAATYTVKADGATITTPYATTKDVNTGICYDTLVTVYMDGAKAWKIGDTVVAYGDTYKFYVGSDVELTAVTDDVATKAPAVAAVKTTAVGETGKVQANFLATRSMGDSNCTFVAAGFVYGKNIANADTMTLVDVDNTTIKAYYCSTNAEQFALNYGIKAQTGTVSARAFLAYVDADGNTKVVYAKTQNATYGIDL